MNLNKLKFEFQKKGYVIIRNFFDKKKIISIKKKILTFNDYKTSNSNGHSVFEKNNNKKFLKYFKKINLYIDEFNYFISSKTFIIAKKLLNEEVYYYNMGLHNKPPGTNSITPAHQDNFYWNLKSKNGCTAYIPLDEQNELNGSIGYFVGSHQGKTQIHKKSKTKAFSSYVDENRFKKNKLEFINIKPGDIVFHHCNIAHKALGNKTKNNERMSVAITIYGINSKFDIKMKKKYLGNLN